MISVQSHIHMPSEGVEMDSIFTRLRSRPAIVGTFASLGSMDAIELAAHTGMDFVIVDWQHGSFDQGDMAHAVRAIHAAGCLPIARPPAHALHCVECLLDMGYSSLLIPMVNSAEKAQEVAEAALYPPAGLRSQSSCRASLRSGSAYRQEANSAHPLMVMIEHVGALDDLEAIVSVPGVSGCFVGRTDLSSSMGIPGCFDAPALNAAIDRVRCATVAAGKIAGIAVRSLEEAQQRIAEGFHLVSVSSDRRLLQEAMVRIWPQG